MPTVTQTRLQNYLDAETKILKGQSVRLGERQLTLADLVEVRAAITELQRGVNAEAGIAAGRAGFAQADFGGCT